MEGTLTTEQAAAKLGVSLKTVYRMLHRGELEGEQTALWRPWRISTQSIRRRLEHPVRRGKGWERSGMAKKEWGANG